MHAVDLIASAIEWKPVPENVQAGLCAVTGIYGPCIARHWLFGKSFTNIDLLAAPDSDRVSVNAYQALAHKWERMSSWYCDSHGFFRLKRQEIRTMMLDRAYRTPWAGYVTTSYKKHGALRAPVNGSSTSIWLFELERVDCSDHVRLVEMWTWLNEELRGGIGRSVMETLEPNPYVIKRIGLRKWLRFEERAHPIYQGILYRFLCYLLPSQEELKKEGENDSDGMATEDTLF